MSKLTDLTIAEARDGLRDKSFSSRELTQAHVEAIEAARSLRWLIPTALFDLFRGVRPRYLSREQFDAMLHNAGFEVLERRRTFLGGISLLAWTRSPIAAVSPRP